MSGVRESLNDFLVIYPLVLNHDSSLEDITKDEIGFIFK